MRKRTLFAIGIPAAAAAIAIAAVFLPGGERQLDGLKKQREVAVIPENADRLVRQALEHIGNRDMGQLFRLMASQDSMKFEANYTAGIFAGKDFCPAEILGASQREKGPAGNLSVTVRSGPRQEDYRFSLLPGKDGDYRIGSITVLR